MIGVSESATDRVSHQPRRRLTSGATVRPMTEPLPVLFFDGSFPDEMRALVEGRAVVVGPGDDDLAGADAVVVGAVRRWDAAALALGPKLRVVSRIGVGYDNVNLADAAAAGIVVCYAPEAPTVSTAEHTMTLMLAVTKSLPALQARAREGLAGALVSSTLELDGATLGLVGLGRIASRVARAAQALGMQVVASDPFVTTSPVDGVRLVPFEDLLDVSDVISLHAPALPSTHHLINEQTLALMKPGAYLVNCARGGLVDQDALLAALDSGHLAGAALDVTEPEPLPAGHPLLEHARVIVTPHIASATAAGRRRLYEHAIENALAVIAGRPATIVPALPA